MTTNLLYLLCTYIINWEAVSAISQIVLAVVTVAALVFSIYQNWQLRKQKHEDERARLSISIIERNGYYQLRITNVGLQTAYNIILKFNKEFLEIIKKNYFFEWENIQARPFIIERGNSLYLDILLIILIEEIKRLNNTDISTLKAKGHHNIAWLKQYGNKMITVNGSYNGAYKIKEELSLLDFIILGVEKDENPIVDALNNIGKGIGTGKYSSSISEQLNPIKDYFSNENSSRRVYGNRCRPYQESNQQQKEYSIWSIIKRNIKKRFK